MLFHQSKSALFVIVALIAMLLLSGSSPAAADTPTAVPPATTSVNATATVIAPTATRLPATTVITPTATITQTIVPPTAIPPVATRIPPTATRVAPTATRVPPSPTRASAQAPVVRTQSRAPLAPETNFALQFDGTNDYVTFGASQGLAAPGLGVQTFTIETWFMRTGAGVTTSTGTGGLASAVPLVTKGRGEAENSDVDMNYFFGIDSTGVLAADFEECARSQTGCPATTSNATQGGQNFPARGTTVIQNNVWYHAAVTFDGRYWRFYINGTLDGTIDTGANRLPRWDSRQHAGIGTAMTSTGATAGFFAGVIDEVRIWNLVRTQAEIQADMNNELTAGNGLIARWGLNDGSGTTASNSIAGRPNGTLTNGPIWACGRFAVNCGLRFDGTNDYVTFGTASGLGAQTFTIETWFRRTGAGVAVSTGTNGVTAVPLVTKGSPQADGSNVDENYILGIRSSDNVLAGDFEIYQACNGRPAGDNTPIVGVTPIVNDTWYHAAFTFDGTALRLYLNGNLESTVANTCLPRYDSIQHAGLGTYLTSDGTASGYFQGVLDEVRIWNVARTQLEIQSTINSQLTSGTGLIGRWGMNENQGTVINDSIAPAENGTLTNGPIWVTGAPFNISFTPPNAPSGLNATAPSAYQVNLTWTDNSTNEANFEIERGSNAGGPFSLLTTVSVNTTTYADANVNPTTQYCYRVRATNAAGSSAYSNVSCVTTPAESASALDFGSSNAYVTFGDANSLDLAQFTLETWFRRDGTGVTQTTGSGGIPNAIPLISNGAQEADGSTVDINYVLCIDNATSTLCADFEEGASGSSPGLNHPVYGVTPITTGQWYHAAVTYDGTTWRLYLNGNLETTLTVGQPVRADNISPTALATMLNSTNGTNGFFDGVLDEVRIWNYVRTNDQIRSTINTQITTPQTGLVARWGLNEGSGTTVTGSAGTSVNGTVTGTGYSWITPGAPFNANFAPNTPSGNQPANGATNISVSTTLTVTVTDPENDAMTVRFYGRRRTSGGTPFSLVFLPDTQYYTTPGNQPLGATIFNGQTNWIVNNQSTRNIVFVGHLGDITENGGNDTDNSEWIIADAAFDILDAANIPYNVAPGNHDMAGGVTRFENYFGISRFSGRSYYGGNYGTDNTNNYNLFSASGLDFILIDLYCYNTAPPTAVLDWANNLLATNSGRLGIVVCHDLLTTTAPAYPFSTAGQAVYNALRGNPNLLLMLGGHLDQAGRRTDVYNGNTVYSMRSDYQTQPNGGNGWLRILEFQPANNQIQVSTYSPYLNQNLTDANNQFTLPFTMSGPWQLLGTVNNVASGSTASINWQGLDFETEYEWYVTASDAAGTTPSSIWSFTTMNYPTAVTLSSFSASANHLPDGWLAMLGAVIGILVATVGGWRLIKH